MNRPGPESHTHGYCTYFDHRYLARGLAMIRSLRRAGEHGPVWVLCLSDEAHEALVALGERNVHPISMTDFEAAQAPIADTRADRSLIEYFFTCTAALVRESMSRSPESVEWITYLDGDLWFFHSPGGIYRELKGSSVGIIEHRFANKSEKRSRFGTYNVGWVSFRRDRDGTECARWWDDRCREWCRDELSDGKFADQGYLDSFSRVASRVHVIESKGANLAPWNLARYQVAGSAGAPTVDGELLMFFHFHGLDRSGSRFFFKHLPYGAKTTPLIREQIYKPYLTELLSIEAEIAPLLPQEIGALPLKRTLLVGPSLAAGRKRALRLAARLRGDSLKLGALSPSGESVHSG